MKAVRKQVLATEKFDAISKTLFEVALAPPSYMAQHFVIQKILMMLKI